MQFPNRFLEVYPRLKELQRRGYAKQQQEIIGWLSDQRIESAIVDAFLGMIAVCIDAEDACEPDGVPPIHIMVSQKGMSRIDVICQMLDAKNPAAKTMLQLAGIIAFYSTLHPAP